jgi:tRNA modification GTPase
LSIGRAGVQFCKPMTSGDTIAAISSAVGAAARIIVRVSGAGAWGMAVALCPGASLAASAAISTRLRVRDFSVPVTLYCFQSPRSYTGEDLIEFHIPGNPLLARLLLNELIARGARAADPGEFTARAYFQGRLDLTEAEGVAATIAAQSEEELRAARQLLGGELARRLRPAMDLLAQTLGLIEVGIDFSEEEVTFLSGEEVRTRIGHLDGMLAEIVEQSARFERLSHAPRAVLVGRPNAGKSTLLNALAGSERAVVSAVAGTTRDALSAPIALRHGILVLIDAAGIEELSGNLVEARTAGARIEKQMRERALGEVEAADLVLHVHDASSSEPPMRLPRPADLVILSKSDLGVNSAAEGFLVSARTGHNLDALRDRLDGLAFARSSAGASLALNARHLQAIAGARMALAHAAGVHSEGAELTALDLRDALDSLGSILGGVTPDDLLGLIFSTFCIGK